VSIDAAYDPVASSSIGGNAAAAAAQFIPRLQLVQHSSGPIRALNSSRKDVLLLDINLQQLLGQLEAHTRQQQQQQRASSRQRQQQQQQHSGGRSSLSIDGESWLPSGAISRPGSLDLGAMPGGMESAAVSPHAYAAAGAAAAAAASDASLSRQGSGHSWHSSQLSGIAEGSGRNPQHTSSNTAHHKQQYFGGAVMQQRRQLAPAVALALQALCVLHRWGCDSQLDDQLAALLLEAGLVAAAPLVQPQQQQQQLSTMPAGWSARPSIDEHNSTAEAVLGGDVCSSSSRGMSPSGPEQAAAGASLLVGSPTSPAAAAGRQQRQFQHQQRSPHAPDTAMTATSRGELHQEQLLLHQLAQLLQDAQRSGPQLLRCCPCLSQEVLLSSNGAVALSLPAARAAASADVQQQQQQQVAPSGVLLRASPSLLSCR
jgi:hypothetical protein